jgi:hypothetical protein
VAGQCRASGVQTWDIAGRLLECPRALEYSHARCVRSRRSNILTLYVLLDKLFLLLTLGGHFTLGRRHAILADVKVVYYWDPDPSKVT